MVGKVKCPVCGNLIEDYPCEICTVCDWERDYCGEHYPDKAIEPNGISLNQARKEWFEKQNKIEKRL